jgi:hypothetical protein
MADEPTSSGWLPPRAPGAEPAPQYESSPPPEPEVPEPPPPAEAALAPPSSGARPRTFVKPAGSQTNGLALTALILGILGVTVLLLTLGLGFLFTLPCSIAAWICAAQARARIAVGETTAGRGHAQAGYILGVIGVVLGVMAMVGWIAAIASGLDLEELRDDIERQTNPDAVEAIRIWIAANLGLPS